jgi:error-prone DNA polymerase
VRAQVDKELALIEELDYPGYFLTMHEIVAYCRAQAILCQGRGSAANSAVCYCLGITAVDPVHMDLLFERFLSRERAEPPDIDLDIEHERREEVIQHVYAQVRPGATRRWSPTSIRYRMRSAMRDVGKALGIARNRARPAQQAGPTVDDGDWPRMLRERRRIDADARAHSTSRSWSTRSKTSRATSRIHPGGFLLGHEPVDDAGADRERGDGRPHRHPVGQGRRRDARPVQGRPVRARRAAHSCTCASTCMRATAGSSSMAHHPGTTPPPTT